MLKSELVITRAEPQHWGRFRAMRLAALAESPAVFGSTAAREKAFDEEEWRRRAQRLVTFLASLDGTDVGLVGVHEFDGNWTVVSMWISPETRSLGIVDALMEACENFARQAGSDSLVLGVMEENTAGRRAYRRLGFEPIARRDHIGDGRYEMWMAKSLNPAQESPLTAGKDH